MTLTPTDTRAELHEALTNLSAFAQRQQYVIEKLSSDQPTAWTIAHHKINNLLDELDRAG